MNFKGARPKTMKPKLMTKLMPRIEFTKGIKSFMNYDMFHDIIYIHRDTKYKYFCMARALCMSTTHENRLNTFDGGPCAIDARHCLDQVELNLSTYFLLFYMGPQAPCMQHTRSLIESWTNSYYFKTGHKPKIDWPNVLRVASYYVPKDRQKIFRRKVKGVVRHINKKYFLTKEVKDATV